MTFLIFLYVTAFCVSTSFFLWAACAFFCNRQTAKPRPAVEVGPDSEPLIVALYCQYLVAPQKALEEAQRAVLLTAGRHRPSRQRLR